MLSPSFGVSESLSNRLQAAFIRLAKDDSLWRGDLEGAMRQLATFLADALDVARASIWLLREGQLECRVLFCAPQRSYSQGQVLDATSFPNYFHALDTSRVIDAADAINDLRTAEFAAAYLQPLGIQAMLDATLYQGGRLSGVVCLEHIGSRRLWSRDEQNFVVSVADLLSQIMVFHALKDSESCYRTLFDSAGDAIITLRGGRLVDCNQRAMELFGCSREQFMTLHSDCLSPPQQADGRDSASVSAEYNRRALEGSPQYFPWTCQRFDGTVFETEVSLTRMWLAGVRHTMAIVRDVTERHQAESARLRAVAELEQRNNALQIVHRLATRVQGMTDSQLIAEETVSMLYRLHAPQAILFHGVSADGNRLHSLAALGQGADCLSDAESVGAPRRAGLTGAALGERRVLISRNVALDPRIDAEQKARMQENDVRTQVCVPLVYRSEALGCIGLFFAEGANPLGEIELEALNTISQTVSLALVNARNVQVLEHQAMHDSLTGLPNRAHLHREAAGAIERAKSEGDGLALMLLDLDRFKEVNDTLGHHTGDQLIKLVGERLLGLLAARSTMLSRLGGDEFAVLVADAPTAAEAGALATDIVAALRQPFEVQGIFIELGASIGVAMYPEHGSDSHSLLRCADVAMYAAKNAVTGFSLYDASHDQHNPRRLAMLTELGSAIHGDQLVLHYQPKFDLDKRRWSGCEALVRWTHPQLGFIPPGEFIGFAESTDLIRPLTLWVARTAIAQLSKWREAGLTLTMAINLSTRNLLDVTLPEALAELLAEFNVPAECLELEITETALLGDPNRALAVVNRLVELGMKLSIDDFGTGYSSLSYLKRLPLYALKIDRSFVSDMMQDEHDGIIVRSTIGLAHSLGLLVVAEGVEDAATLAALRDIGCDQAQGYFLATPLPAATVDELLKKPLSASLRLVQ